VYEVSDVTPGGFPPMAHSLNINYLQTVATRVNILGKINLLEIVQCNPDLATYVSIIVVNAFDTKWT